MARQILLDYDEFLQMSTAELELKSLHKDLNARVLKDTEQFMGLLEETALRFPTMKLEDAVKMLGKVRSVLFAPKKV